MKNMFKSFSIPMHSMPKPPTFNILNTAYLNLTTTKDILDFLKESGIKQFELAELQSRNADKQFRNNRKLTILALIFAFISIVPIIREYISTSQTKKSVVNKYEFDNRILLQSNTILENQVRILKTQNELILSNLKKKNNP